MEVRHNIEPSNFSTETAEEMKYTALIECDSGLSTLLQRDKNTREGAER